MTQLLDSNGNTITRPNKNNPKVPGVYMIIHPATGKAYLGSTENLYGREKKHKYMLKSNSHTNKPLQEAYNQDNRTEFVHLSMDSREKAYEYEQLMLDDFSNTGSIFNIAIDAKASTKGLTRSDDTKIKIGIAHTGKKASPEQLLKQSLSHLGKVPNQNQLDALKLGGILNLKNISINGVIYKGAKEISEALNLTTETVYYRINSSSDQFKNWFYL